MISFWPREELESILARALAEGTCTVVVEDRETALKLQRALHWRRASPALVIRVKDNRVTVEHRPAPPKMEVLP